MFMRRGMEQPKEMSLNITSLMDILTIILLFLIISFSTEETEVNPPKGLELPSSSSQRPVKLAVKMSVLPDELRVEDRVVASLAGGRLRSGDLDRDRLVTPLLRELQRQRARLQSGSKARTTPKAGDDDEGNEDEILYVEAAQGIRFEIIDRLLKTAAAAGFTKFRLAVRRRL